MIIKTAARVEKTTQELTAQLKENYVAASDFGQYIATLSAYLEANPEALTQYYSFVSDLKTNVEAVDAAFSHYKVDTEGYIRTGIVYYEGAVPVYGVAVGQGLTCREVDGEKVVDQSNFRAVFTATRLSFWHGGGLCVQQPAVYHQHYGAGRYRHRTMEHRNGGGRAGVPMDRRVRE